MESIKQRNSLKAVMEKQLTCKGKSINIDSDLLSTILNIKKIRNNFLKFLKVIIANQDSYIHHVIS